MAKPSIQITRDELQAQIAEIESKNSFENLSQLWKAIEATEWAQTRSPRPLKASLCHLKYMQWGLDVKTPKGRKIGAGAGVKAPRERSQLAQQRASKYKATFVGLRTVMPEKFHHFIDKAEAGSTKAAVALKCIDCAGFERTEVAQCTVTDCSLYHIRPYKN